MSGTLYGTTYEGRTNCGTSGCGTIFSLTLSSNTETVSYAFQGGNDGSTPFTGLTNLNGPPYGTTVCGGSSYDEGTVFAYTP